jgi:hypothetical protein
MKPALRLFLCLTLIASISAVGKTAENPLTGLLSTENLKNAKVANLDIAAGERPDWLTLNFHSREAPGLVVVPVPQAARDWTKGAALSFEFVSTSTIRFSLVIRNRKGEEFTYRVQPMEKLPVKVVITASLLTREYMNNRQFKGYWISNWGNHIDLTDVESIAISMSPNREVKLKIGNFKLTSEVEQDEFFTSQPVVDEFGQWASGDWSGKIKSLDELKKAWMSEDAELKKKQDFGFSSYGGWKAKQVKATGFFRTVELDGRWWLVDPDGHLFFSVGPDCVRVDDPTRVTGRERLFAKLPAVSGGTVDFYRANATLRYGEQNFFAGWKAKVYERLKSWSFNTVANWSNPVMFENPQAPFVTNVRIGRSRKSWQAYPDAFSEEFMRSAESDAVQQCARYRNEKYLIGYFIGNEPRWPRRNLVGLILNDTEPSATQDFVKRFLKENGDSPASREKLLESLSRKYFSVVTEAIKKADPNHLVLGIRFAGEAPEPVLRANDVFDLFSINIYRFEPNAEQINRIYNIIKKPILIGEFHFGAAERGYAPSLVMVKDQRERGAAYQYFVERAAAMPMIIGAHWFQMVDQPVTGRFDGENYNLGLVNQLDLPYAEMIEAARATHRRMYQVHSGALQPADRKARVR